MRDEFTRLLKLHLKLGLKLNKNLSKLSLRLSFFKIKNPVILDGGCLMNINKTFLSWELKSFGKEVIKFIEFITDNGPGWK